MSGQEKNKRFFLFASKLSLPFKKRKKRGDVFQDMLWVFWYEKEEKVEEMPSPFHYFLYRKGGMRLGNSGGKEKPTTVFQIKLNQNM